LKCPKSFKYTYVDGIRTPGGVPARRGQAYHGTVEELLQFKIDNEGELYPLKRAEKLAIRQGKAENLTDAEIYRVIDAVRFYWHEVYPIHRPLAVEVPFEIIRGGVKITGRIDLIEDTGNIIDHKFSYDTWAMSRAQYGCQPIIYQWAALDAYEKQFRGWEYTGFSYNIIKLFPTPLVQVVHIAKLSQSQSDWWEEQVEAAAKAIAHGAFYANPSESNCKWCDHKKLCNPTVYPVKLSYIGGFGSTDDDI